MALAEFATHLAQYLGGAALGRRTEQGDQTRSRVLGIEIDLAALERAEADRRAGQVETTLHLDIAFGLETLREDLGEESALGEILRAHAQRHLGMGRHRGHE